MDFYSISGMRDLVFHVQEKEYALDEITSMLDILGLEFLGFKLPQPIINLYKKEFPTTSLQSLEHWAQFENKYPDTFSGMYNFFVMRKK